MFVSADFFIHCKRQSTPNGKWEKGRSLVTPIVITICVAMILSIPTLISDLRIGSRPSTAELNDHNNTVIYDVSIHRNEASKIAIQLRKAGIFRDDSKVSVLVRDTGQDEMLIPIKEKAVGTKETREFMDQLSGYLNTNGALKKQLVIFEADSSFKKLE